jgi:outer membrane receptor protein involved in Fe transport
MLKFNYFKPGRVISVIVLIALIPAYAIFAQNGTIKGKITDSNGKSIPGTNVVLMTTTMGAAADVDGNYTISNVPAGTYQLRASSVGFASVTKNVTVEENKTVEVNFKLNQDMLNLKEVVVTGVVAPLSKMLSTVGISTLTPKDLEQMQPRSTSEVLRYVPGFTRVESSGGEVNENISMRGILGVEYVMFMENGLPVYPTMNIYFMNADNLFRPDLNIQKVEVVRGGSSALFGSNTPGAIVNFIDKTGSNTLNGELQLTAMTQGLGRYDFDVNGPIAKDWRFNVGGFYRYDHGVRDPGFPGISGGQFKANVTRLLDNGFIRFSLKYINDRNQFILDLPFENADNPQYVPGLTDYVSMNTAEGNNISVPTPEGRINLPLDHGLLTHAYWLTSDIGFSFKDDWKIENAAQIMANYQEWNAILPSNVMTVPFFYANGLGTPIPAGYTPHLVYTNSSGGANDAEAFSTPNGLIAPSGEWHVEKPMSYFQDQIQLSKSFGKSNFSLGAYFATYQQDNHWYFTNILMDVENNPRFLDLFATNGVDTLFYTKNGFVNYMSNYVNGSGRSTIISPTLAGSIQLTDKLRADVGVRYEYDQFNQASENTSNVNLDGQANTLYDNETWGNNTYRHFVLSIDDWAASAGLNYSIDENWSVYAQGARAYKMPSLDNLLNATAQSQVNIFEDERIYSGEVGIRYSTPTLSFTLDGFDMLRKNITSQGAVIDPTTKQTIWIIVTSPENKAIGLEAEFSATPVEGLDILANGTYTHATLGTGAGADIGSLINGVPKFIGNLSATYSINGFQFLGDMHFVAKRYVNVQVGTNLPAYTYFNFGVSYKVPNSNVTINGDVLNAFQSIGLEEGNPRLLLSSQANPYFLARPILPRRFSLSASYNF